MTESQIAEEVVSLVATRLVVMWQSAEMMYPIWSAPWLTPQGDGTPGVLHVR